MHTRCMYQYEVHALHEQETTDVDACTCTGDLFFPAWEIRKNETSLRALAPCQSLGAFYVKPTPAAMKFLATLSDWVVHTHIQQWDQAAWNEVLPLALPFVCRS